MIIKAIIGLLTVILGLYALSTLPKDKQIDYKASWAWLKKNVFKVLTIGLILYAAYLNILYANAKKDNRMFYEDLYGKLDEVDSLNKVNKELLQEIDSLKANRNKRPR